MDRIPDVLRVNERGFTLIEVFAAMLVFAFGIMALNRLQIATVKGNTYATDLSQATRIAQDKMEDLLDLTITDTDLADNDLDGTNQDPDQDGVDETGGDRAFGLNDSTAATADHTETNGRFSVFWNIAVDQPIVGSRLVRVSVAWTGADNIPHSIDMDCVKGEFY